MLLYLKKSFKFVLTIVGYFMNEMRNIIFIFLKATDLSTNVAT